MVKKKSNAPREHIRLMEKSFQKTLLDAPLKRRRRMKNKQIYFEPLPKPLQPTPYVPPPPKVELPPTPPPRFKRTKVKLRDPRVQKLIEKITPFYTPEAIQEFRDKINKRVAQAEGIKIIERRKALKNTVKSFEVENISTKDPRMLFASTQNAISEKLVQLLKQKGPFKASLTARVELKKRIIVDGEEAYEFARPYFNSPTFTITNEFQIKLELEGGEGKILSGIAKWISKGSGWVIENIFGFYINIVSYVSLKGRSYLPLPEELRNSRKGLINIRNTDNECFRWCHIRHLNPLQRNPQRITARDKELVKTLDYSGVTFPVSIKNMDKIERQNKININVLGYSDGNPSETLKKNMKILYTFY